jgi:hypothetical protein
VGSARPNSTASRSSSRHRRRATSFACSSCARRCAA